ncbi:Smr protein/MutS2 [Parvibaculum lavamentivorans DS-1]|uniref:Smr protein/MutS2 n=2 Tax=Parvibaculum lavamentivorans TaxID=256618 RepID=A7HSI3_PARL1|nr:Smr protein/MutS2 [Parvibaculum lavamentivorans DS-1]
MADETDKKAPRRKSRSRSLSDEERKLWRAVVKDAKPLARKRSIHAAEAALPAEMLSSAATPPAPQPKRMPASVVPPPSPAPRRAPEPPPLTGLERRTSQRLARGQMEVEATLDLHGHSQAEAHGALLGFLSRVRARGLRCVLVITGKGASPYARHTLHGAEFYEVPERQGVLRSAVPRWLNEADFRAHVSGFQPAHPKHGGGGAFYIWLRKKR